jgi:hypothetical protein
VNLLVVLGLLISTHSMPQSLEIADARTAEQVAAAIAQCVGNNTIDQLTWFSESDETIGVVLVKGMETKGEILDAREQVEKQIAYTLDRKGKDTIKTKAYRRMYAELKKLTNLRGYCIGEGSVRPTYIIGGNIGGYFVGIKAEATET